MKIRIFAVAVLAAALVAALVVACDNGDGGNDGDDDGDGAGAIRTRQGLSVASVSALASAQGGDAESDEGTDSAAPAPGAPDVAVGTDRTGVFAPDIAPYPFPALQAGAEGITVQGFASAAADADSAIVEFYFGSNGVGVEPQSDSGGGVSGSSGAAEDLAASPSGQAQPITEADLQPVVDAIVGAGVSPDDIEVIAQPFYGDPYYGGSATVRATVRSIDAVDGVVAAATEAAAGVANATLQGTNVSYAVSDCAALERAAMEAAVADARERGQTFASVLGVGLGAVVAASNYSYSLYGGTPCDTSGGGVYPLASMAYAEGASTEVELFATVSVTFAIS
ncbi:MAG: SIMPL domain-containing protein [Dehalococcoidia bacterium]